MQKLHCDFLRRSNGNDPPTTGWIGQFSHPRLVAIHDESLGLLKSRLSTFVAVTVVLAVHQAFACSEFFRIAYAA